MWKIAAAVAFWDKEKQMKYKYKYSMCLIVRFILKWEKTICDITDINKSTEGYTPELK